MVDHLTDFILAAAGIGAAASALVDGSKAFFAGTSRIGFAEIKAIIEPFFRAIPAGQAPRRLGEAAADAAFAVTAQGDAALALAAADTLLASLWANWINGTPLDQQKAIAKSLLKLHLSAITAPSYALATGRDERLLEVIAGKLGAATPPTAEMAGEWGAAESNEWAKFDFAVTVLLDKAYLLADQQYRNKSKMIAMVVAVLLALLGQGMLGGVYIALLIGAAAVPIAPMAKDLTTALGSLAQAAQQLRQGR